MLGAVEVSDKDGIGKHHDDDDDLVEWEGGERPKIQIRHSLIMEALFWFGLSKGYLRGW